MSMFGEFKRGFCRAPGCDRYQKAKGMCQKHYRQVHEHGKLLPVYGTICQIEGCGKEEDSKGYCRNHYCKLWYIAKKAAITFDAAKNLLGEPKKKKEKKKCIIENCDNYHIAKGLCWKHYRQIDRQKKVASLIV